MFAMKHPQRTAPQRVAKGADHLQQDFHNLISKLQNASLEALPLAQLLYNDLEYAAEEALQEQELRSPNVQKALSGTSLGCTRPCSTQRTGHTKC